MKLKKSYAAAIAAVFCMGSISATVFADGNNVLMPQPVGDEENTNSSENNSASLPDENASVFPLVPVTGDDDNSGENSSASLPDESAPAFPLVPVTDDDDNSSSGNSSASLPDESSPAFPLVPITGSGDKSEATDEPSGEEVPKTDDSGTDSDADNNSEENGDTLNMETPETNNVPVANDVSDNSAEVVPVSTSSESSSGSETSAVDTNKAVRLGETVSVKSEELNGEVKVFADKNDTALEGASFELSALDKAQAAEKLTAAGGGSNDIVDEVVKAVDDGSAVALDIGFNKNGNDVSPAKDVTVTVPVPASLKAVEELFVYHVTDKGIEDVTSKCTYDKDNGTLAITNNAFSPYIISKVRFKAKTAASEPELTAYDENFSTGVALAVAPIVVAGAFVAVIAVKRRR